MRLDEFLALPADRLHEISEITLSDNKIGELDAARIAALGSTLGQCKSLQRLDLRYNNIGILDAARMAALGNALPQCENLQYLDLRGNRIYRLDAAGIAALGGALAQCKSLQRLDLRHNNIGLLNATNIAALGNALAQYENLQYLDLGDNGIYKDAEAAPGDALAQSKDPQHPDFRDNDICQLDVAGMAALGSALALCKSLQHLDLSNNNLDRLDERVFDQLCIELGNCTNLTQIKTGLVGERHRRISDICKAHHDNLVMKIYATSRGMASKELLIGKDFIMQALYLSFPKAEKALIDRVYRNAAKIEANLLDDDGYAQIHLAAAANDTNEIDWLLKHGANVDRETNFKSAAGSGRTRTALHIAAAEGRLKAVRFLLDAGADLNRKANDGSGEKTPLQFAEEALEITNDEGKKQAFQAIIRELKISLENPHMPEAPQERAAAAAAAFTPALKRVGENDRLDAQGYAPIHRATLNGDIEGSWGIKALLHKGIDVNRETNIEHAADSGRTRCTALHFAVAEGQAEAVHLLLQAGADLNRKAQDGNEEKTPLQFAEEALEKTNDNGKKQAFQEIIRELKTASRQHFRPQLE